MLLRSFSGPITGDSRFIGIMSEKEHSTGKHKPERNEADEVLTRQLEKLRIVDDSVWYSANDAIKDHAADAEIPAGRDSPLYGIERNKRGPLSRVFRCRCNRRSGWMAVASRPTAAKVRRGECWNKATSLRDKTHDWLRDVQCCHNCNRSTAESTPFWIRSRSSWMTPE